MIGLKKNFEWSHAQKSHSEVVNSRDVAGNAEEVEEPTDEIIKQTQMIQWSSPSTWLWLLRDIHRKHGSMYSPMGQQQTRWPTGEEGGWGGQRASASMAAGKHCSNYHAETEALIQAASIVQASDHGCKQAEFLSDALSILQAYQNHKLPNLAKALQQVAATRRAVLQWIPGHCGISENEQVDILAKEGARGEQHANNVSFSEKKTLVRALTMLRSQRDDYHLLSRMQQVVLVRLRTGHNRLNSHVPSKLKLAPSPTCPCGQEDQTTEHILQRCPLHEATRKDVWPVSTLLMTKLYSCKQELEKTTSFISRVAFIMLTANA